MKNLITSLRMWAGTVVVCLVLYPASLYLFGQAFAPGHAEGSLVYNESGEVVGSELVAQKFTSPRYLWPRPSAASYDGAATGGSNLSPASPKITERAERIIERYRKHGVGENEKIPAELVTASGSGLDPHISASAARFQAERVAKARGVSVDEVNAVIDEMAESPSGLGSFRVVNVLMTNMELDERFPVEDATASDTTR